MSSNINITDEEILKQVKMSLKIPEILEGIATRKIVINAANEAGIEVEVEELQKAADQFRLTSKLETAKDTHEWLEKHQLSVDDFEEMIELGIISAKLTQHLFADQVESYFYQNQLDYAGAIIYEIVLDDQDLALELFYTIEEEDMSFWDVAHQYIKDPELRRKGGYLGLVKRKDLNPEISAQVFAANAPQVLQPIMTNQGFHLILVEEIIKPELDKKTRLNIISDLFSQWLKHQLGKDSPSGDRSLPTENRGAWLKALRSLDIIEGN